MDVAEQIWNAIIVWIGKDEQKTLEGSKDKVKPIIDQIITDYIKGLDDLRQLSGRFVRDKQADEQAQITKQLLLELTSERKKAKKEIDSLINRLNSHTLLDAVVGRFVMELLANYDKVTVFYEDGELVANAVMNKSGKKTTKKIPVDLAKLTQVSRESS